MRNERQRAEDTAWRWFSRHVRIKNAVVNGNDLYTKCYTSGKWYDVLDLHAGHYRTVGGHNSTKYDEKELYSANDLCKTIGRKEKMTKRRTIVHVSDAKVSCEATDVLTTYSLGSCIGVSLYDPATHIGGMLHYQLPSSKMDPKRAQEKPLMFADTGMKILLAKLVGMGANKKRLRVKIAGGAMMETGPKGFDIGKRNHLAIRKILWKDGLFIDAEDVGGCSARNMYMHMNNGQVTIRSNGLEKELA